MTHSVKILTLLFFIMSISSCNAQPKHRTGESLTLKELLVEIREETISEAEARLVFAEIAQKLQEQYPTPKLDSANMQMVFPLRGKNYRDVGGKGRGFYARLFNLFDHSISRSHPAHDIFIYDVNRDLRDDNNGEFVDILAVNDGFVVATETNWQEGDEFKGGNYVWLYDFTNGGLWYYAHMRQVYAVEGQLVKAGDKLGEVGRTGFNAENRRSDTHLHLMFLAIDENGSPRPINHYPWLKKAKTVYKTQLPTHFPRKNFDIGLIKPNNTPVYLPTNLGMFGLPSRLF
ncbi:Peptidase family M23 [Spirosomataceae bacterium TFI 002]|nr:Peptidase family M23 [Spirosomataceae bacterium TFI 002]